MNRFVCGQRRLCDVDKLVAAVREVDPAGVPEVAVICHREAYFAVASENYFAVDSLNFIDAFSVAAINDLKLKSVSNFRGVSFYQIKHPVSS